jgi:hypothetical protein
MKKKKTVPRSGTPQSSSRPVPPSPATIPPGKQVSPTTTNNFKAFILLVTAVVTLLIFFGLEPNKL